MSRPTPISPRNLRRLARRRGFTLVELMISLVMGLIIALAAVSLARTATDTFYEQARISGVEAAIRTASERFRSDLSRASFMSTPNIRRDPKVARDPSAAAYHVPSLRDLQGIRIEKAAMRTHDLSVRNGVTPHDVYIAGNLTTNDVYRGIFYSEDSGCAASGGSGASIRLTRAADPAVRRLFNGEEDVNAQRIATEIAFLPHRRLQPPLDPDTYSHAVQVMDMRGCFHYLEVCGVVNGPTAGTVILQLTGGKGLLNTTETGNDVCGARLMEEVAIAPIQRVRWSLGTESAATLATGRYDPVLDGPDGQKKLNLQRQVLAADGVTPVGPPELVAEYGVDLKLGLMIDNSTTATPSLLDVDFEAEDDVFKTWGAAVSTITTPNVGPQRIRSVRYRLAFRTSFADRTSDLAMPGGRPYMARYCMLPGSPGSPCTTFSRVRTVISEVALVNQAKAVY